MRLWVTVLIVSGCASAPQYGSFLQGQHQAQAALAADAASKLSEDYEPQNVGVVYTQQHADPFGRGLSAGLQDAGFAVRRGTGGPKAFTVRYVVDQIKGTALLRVTMRVRGRVLSRAYATRATGAVAVGPWSSGGTL